MFKSWIASACVAAATALAPGAASAAIVPFAQQGVIVENISGSCTTFEADNGGTYILSSLGGFSPGDRVYVTGSYNDQQYGVCFTIAAPRVTVTAVKPAFAGVGTLVRLVDRARFQTDDGRVFNLQNAGNYPTGTRVYVQGTVTVGRATSTINANVIGPAMSEFGRITFPAPGVFRLAGESGAVYQLDRPGSIASVFEGDYVFVEGIRGATTNGVTAVTSVTARPAFHASGHIVAGPNGNEFAADTVFANGNFTAAALAGFPVGSKVYLLGRNADDYDYGESKPVRNIRQSFAEASYTAVGVLNTANHTMIDGSNGTVVHLEYNGNADLTPNGSQVYVAGTISSQGLGTVTLSHNEVRIGIAGEGVLLNGFGCTPIIQFDAGGYIFPKNNGGFPVGTYVRVIGGYSFDVPCNDEGGLVDNSIEVADGCPNCQ